MREATLTKEPDMMRALRFEFHPEQVRISSEEILADLRYPAREIHDDGGRKRARRRSGRR